MREMEWALAREREQARREQVLRARAVRAENLLDEVLTSLSPESVAAFIASGGGGDLSSFVEALRAALRKALIDVLEEAADATAGEGSP